MHVPQEKQQLRKAALAHRATLVTPDFAVRLAAHAEELDIPPGVIISGYAAVKDEADPRELLLLFAAKGHPIALPRIDQRAAPLQFHIWKQGDVMRAGVFGIEEPVATAARVAPSVVLVPLLAFDGRGHRLGYGGGYYDCTLAALRSHQPIQAIGVAYAGQEVQTVPNTVNDQPLDAVITEKGVRRFAPGRA